MTLLRMALGGIAWGVTSAASLAFGAGGQSWMRLELVSQWGDAGKVREVQVLRAGPGMGMPVMGNPDAQFLFNNREQDYGSQLGTRLTWGRWLDPARRWGLELSGQALAEGDASWSYREGSESGASATLVFINTLLGGTFDGLYILTPGADPGEYGGIDITSHSRKRDFEALLVRNLARDETRSLDALLGLKYVGLSEDFQIALTNHSSPSSSPYPPDYEVATRDRWGTRNRILAVKVGLRGQTGTRHRFTSEASLALGPSRQTVEVSGSTRITASSTEPLLTQGGLFSGPCNIGARHRTALVLVPELKLGFEQSLTPKTALTLRAHATYVSRVVRPGEQVNRTVNLDAVGAGSPTPDPTLADPARRFKTTDYFSYGLSLGLKATF